MKKVEGQPEGGDAAGWGVEEADARNKKEASMLSRFLSIPFPLPPSPSYSPSNPLFPDVDFASREER
jgi:hypothetical protein